MGYEPLEFCREKGRGPFYGAARWLWEKQKAYRRGRPERGASLGAQEALLAIYGEAQAKAYYERFQIHKNEKLIFIFAAGMGLACALWAVSAAQGRSAQVSALERPGAAEGSRRYEMNVLAGEERLTGIVVEVPAGQMNQAEIQEALDAAEEELDGLVQSWNPDAVDADLSFPDTLCDGLVDVRFESSRYDLLDGAGHVRNELTAEEGEVAELRAVLGLCGSRREVVYPVRIVPKGQDMASRLARETARQLLEEETQEESKVFILPDEFEGKPLAWEPARPAYGGWVALLTAAGCLVLNVAFESDLAREGDKRREELLLSYPSFLARLTLLAGTGMPVRTAFLRMAKEAERKGASPVYEEVLRTCREMESGTTELQAYENFGKRCRLPQYKKCASLLSQNVRKGAGGLMAALNQEAANAFEERKALARRKGEEAQTRMLLPMLMMLAVVMLLVMVPAWFSFGGI